MHYYIIKRVLMLLLVASGVSFLVYFIMDFSPGDTAVTALGLDASHEEYEEYRIKHGLNDPLVIRYGRYMWNLAHGDIGQSSKYNKPVWDLYKELVGNTFILALSATIVATLISIPLGIYSALHQGGIGDNVASVLSIVSLATPHFWLGIMLIILFSLKLGWFSSGGFTTWSDVVLPAFTVGTGHAALVTRTTRSSMLDVLGADYLMLARAKGLTERVVIWKHALKNALIPILTVTGIQFTGALGGSVVSETVYSWPGVGRMTIDAIKSQDIEVATGFIIMTAFISSVILLVIDILYAFVDPRIKAKYNKTK
jgi:peptide/nickel transport system permease protein